MAAASAPPKSGWETLLEQPEDKKHGAHNERNQGPICEGLLRHLEGRRPEGRPLRVLEVASGTGQHAAYMPSQIGSVLWQPTDFDPVCVKSTDLWTADQRELVLPCALLDVTADPGQWPVGPCSQDVVYNCNMIHLAPTQVMQGFCAGAGTVVVRGGTVFLYGPFTLNGEHVSESNANFDAKLRERDPSWGVRSVEEVQAEMSKAGLEMAGRDEMPSNNMLLVFRKSLSQDE